LKSEGIKAIIIIVAISVFSFIQQTFMNYIKSLMIEAGLVNNMRETLYYSFLRKHMGYFDEKAHVPAILVAAMNAKTSQLKDAGLNGTLPYVEFFSALIGLCAFCYPKSWIIATVILVYMPFNLLANCLKER